MTHHSAPVVERAVAWTACNEPYSGRERPSQRFYLVRDDGRSALLQERHEAQGRRTVAIGRYARRDRAIGLGTDERERGRA
ncbi:MAG: hypothetical protein FJX72_05245 [Armatimonadetes bacterium]|nr:hypothetical protein [Armatimonadota bacterium]